MCNSWFTVPVPAASLRRSRCSRGTTHGLLALALAASACTGPGSDEHPPRGGDSAGTGPASPNSASAGAESTYYRTIAFLSMANQQTMIVPWDFENRSTGEGVQRTLRGWLGRGGRWSQFADEEWSTPPSRSPWGILPRGEEARLIVGDGGVVRELYYRQGIRDLAVRPGALIAEWRGSGGDTYRLHTARARLAEVEYGGVAMDAFATGPDRQSHPPGWLLLVGDGPLYLLVAESRGAGSHRAWALRGDDEKLWPAVALSWTETATYGSVGLEVPVAWTLDSGDGTLLGEIEPVASQLQAVGGEGGVLPELGGFEVEGEVRVDGVEARVRGFLRRFAGR